MNRDEAAQLQKGLADWAEREPSWRALALVGSWARGRARENSDLDLVALADSIEQWTADDAWLRDLIGQLGLTTASLDLEVHGVARSWRVRLSSGAELELTLADTRWAHTEPLDQGTRRVVSDGMRPLVDKDGLLHAVASAVVSAGC